MINIKERHAEVRIHLRTKDAQKGYGIAYDHVGYAVALRLGTACGSATAFSLGLATKEKIDELLAQL